jgi:hypothetical protein
MFSSANLGFGLSILAITALVIYMGCFAAILFVNKPFKWTDFEDFVKYEASSRTVYKYIGMACMIVFACAFVVITICVGDTVKPEKEFLANISTAFALAFCITICINYYVQITATRLQLKSGQTDGLTQFTQSYNISFINSVNMLGWTLFYAISTFCLAFLFDSSIAGGIAKCFCLVNTFVMCLGLLGYAINHFILIALSMNLGLGVAAFGMIIPMAIMFLK